MLNSLKKHKLGTIHINRFHCAIIRIFLLQWISVLINHFSIKTVWMQQLSHKKMYRIFFNLDIQF